MEFYPYYAILEMHDGDWNKATPSQMAMAKRMCSTPPTSAMRQAERKYKEQWPEKAKAAGLFDGQETTKIEQ